jgi:deoxyadenosine/deoxycytidine kinase
MPDPAFKPPHYIVVEGPIRVGKSTLAKALAGSISARRIYDCDDNPFLHGFYNETPGSAFAAQMHFLYERHRLLMEAEIEHHTSPVVGDFLFEKDKIFAYINLDNDELKLYEKYFDSLALSVPSPDLVIYLQAKPEVLRARVSRKGIPEETEISPEYLQTVANAYEHFFFRYSGSNLLVVDTSEIDFVERNGDLKELLRRLRQPVKGTQYFLPLGQS